MSDTTVVICSKCNWSGAIEDASWMQEHEFGYCPSCGSSEFKDLESWEQIESTGRESEGSDFTWHDKLTWIGFYPIAIMTAMLTSWTGWKARVAVYVLMASAFLFGLVPWVWGWCSFFKWVF
jgi:hypothetical protein